MTTSQAGSREINHIHNPNAEVSEADAVAFTRLHERHFARMDEEHAILRDARPTEDIRALKHDTDALLIEALPVLKVTREQIVGKFTPLFNKVRAGANKLGLGRNYFEDEPLRLPPGGEGIGEFWWAETTFFSDFRDLTVTEQGDFVHIFGHVHYEGDPLRVGSVGYIQDYALTPNRFPSTTKTSFVVHTEVRIGGILSGFTGFYHWLWAADDKWCKCRQIIQPTASLSTGLVLSSDPASAQWVDLNNVSPVGQINSDITLGQGGVLHFDADLEKLAKSKTSILVQILTRYEIQLEGDADIWFRRFGGSAAQSVPGMGNAVRHRSMPMRLTPS